MPVEVMRAFDAKYGVNVLEGYGLSETSPVASFNVLDRPKKAGSIGVPIWGVGFRLIDDEGNVITDHDTPGEICIKGHNVMKGYYKRPEANAEAIEDGWFHTGDIAKRDGDGYYFIVDRKKDMIIRGGFNVYPREVEEVALRASGRRRSGRHRRPPRAARRGDQGGHRGEARRKPAPDAIVAYCKERLAAYKYPRVVEIAESLPKGPTGKILKRELR